MPSKDGHRLPSRPSAAAALGCGGCAKRREWLRRRASLPVAASGWMSFVLIGLAIVLLATARGAWAQADAAQSPLSWLTDGAQPTQQDLAAPANDQSVETIAPDTRRELLIKFMAQNPQAREHLLNMPMNAYANTSEAPGLRLKRMWVGDGGTLLEIEGLPVPGQPGSAVIRQDTFELVNDKGHRATLQAAEGVTILKDRRGGSALVVKAGDTLLALFGPVDDARPMRLQHTTHSGKPYVYFENIFPRFRERYDASYLAAAAQQAKPEAMRDFLVDFAQNDPDNRALGVFQKLLTAMRAQNSFEGFNAAHELTQDDADLQRMKTLAKTEAQKAVVFNTLLQRYRAQRNEALLPQAKAFITTEAQRTELQALINSIEEERAAASRRQEQERQAQIRREEEQRQAARQREAEERCMNSPQCRAEVENRRAQCTRNIQGCRNQCDTTTGSGSYSSFFANLAAAGMARVCYAACKCDSGFGDLLAKFNDLSSSSGSAGARQVSREAVSSMADRGNSDQKIWRCKVYCKSASGPVVWKEVGAKTRREAAKWVGDNAHDICKAQGKEFASSLTFSENQCTAQ